MRKILACAAVFAIACLIWSMLGGPEVVPPPKILFHDPEQWAKAASEQGEGEIRYQAPGSVAVEAAGETASGHGAVVTVPSLGPVSDDAVVWLAAHCDTVIGGSELKLEESMSYEKASRRALVQLEALKDIYLYKAVQELLISGSYVTFPVGKAPPPCPPKCASVGLGPAPLRDGGEVMLVVWVAADRRRALGDIYQLLAETRQAARWERLREWNNRPELERRAEIEDYLALSQKANGDATKNLTADEFVRYWRLHAVLLELDAEAIHGRTMIFERQGSGGR